jgi:quercetin dioxygenase-like cupin family protein
VAPVILKTGAASLILGIAELAFATPPSTDSSRYVNYTLVIDPDAADRVQINLPTASEYEEDVPASHGTRSPSVFVFQDATIYPNKNTGWHYHPGIVLVTIAAGSVEWYDMNCTKRVRVAGDFFTESDQVHFIRNASSVPLRMIITFIIAKGLTSKISAPAPPCAAALGLQ